MKVAGSLLPCLALALAGCGLKGPLYLPEKPGEVVTRGPGTETAASDAASESPASGETATTQPEATESPKQP